MSSSTARLAEREGQNTHIPDWIRSFLGRSFAGSCPTHHFPKNEINRYCISCDNSICQHCIQIGSHADHPVVRVYKIVRKDAVLPKEMNKHFDCKGIQAYKNNQKLVVALNPLPHTGSEAPDKARCDICKRVLNQKFNSYCSIACKVEAISSGTHDGEPDVDAGNPEPPQTRCKRPRKGVPHRAAMN